MKKIFIKEKVKNQSYNHPAVREIEALANELKPEEIDVVIDKLQSIRESKTPDKTKKEKRIENVVKHITETILNIFT
ncbi:hypothetical protein MUA26_07615 [Staphylococcus sp. IVB6246]|uniref:hypothetical protein n=1 Tax=unclassified Staphylococcus TaxID=91994 RepID=UPI0021D23D2B|nr:MULTISPECIES: hypothetical protein [unclassified Staphylococcus]UXR69009.1 hypothetical protein MUA26_07615 [Staphylococcus sp. IVB6246]UXR73334.1 hypothetical protein MUA48_08115 [Staphylococcus sp. IVB6238]UXR77674.1 hypothetical protein MUA92_07265 [Staphylococcus sp. IVB6227]